MAVPAHIRDATIARIGSQPVPPSIPEPVFGKSETLTGVDVARADGVTVAVDVALSGSVSVRESVSPGATVICCATRTAPVVSRTSTRCIPSPTSEKTAPDPLGRRTLANPVLAMRPID